MRGQIRPGLDVGGGAGHNALDVLRSRGTALCERTHFLRHYGKPAAHVAGACRLHRCVQCQDIGLKSNAVDHADDVRDLPTLGVQCGHALHKPVHRALRFAHRTHQLRHFAVGSTQGRDVLGHPTADRVHVGGDRLDRRGTVLGPGREVAVAGGDFAGGARDLLGALMHAVQGIAHGPQ